MQDGAAAVGGAGEVDGDLQVAPVSYRNLAAVGGRLGGSEIDAILATSHADCKRTIPIHVGVPAYDAPGCTGDIRVEDHSPVAAVGRAGQGGAGHVGVVVEVASEVDGGKIDSAYPGLAV